MGATTRSNVFRPHQKKASLKKRESSSKITKPASKRVKEWKSIHPDDAFEEVIQGSPEIEPAVLPPPMEDVSNQVFTLTWSIMLGSVEVDSDSEKLKLGEFKY